MEDYRAEMKPTKNEIILQKFRLTMDNAQNKFIRSSILQNSMKLSKSQCFLEFAPTGRPLSY